MTLPVEACKHILCVVHTENQSIVLNTLRIPALACALSILSLYL